MGDREQKGTLLLVIVFLEALAILALGVLYLREHRSYRTLYEAVMRGELDRPLAPDAYDSWDDIGRRRPRHHRDGGAP